MPSLGHGDGARRGQKPSVSGTRMTVIRPPGSLLDDQRLREQAARVPDALHPQPYSRGSAYSRRRRSPSSTSRHELLVPDDEEVTRPGGVGDGAELAAGAGADQHDAVVGDRVRAAHDVVRSGAELAHLAPLRRAVELRELAPHRVVAAGFVDLGRDADARSRSRESAVCTSAPSRDRVEHELPGLGAARRRRAP